MSSGDSHGQDLAVNSNDPDYFCSGSVNEGNLLVSMVMPIALVIATALLLDFVKAAGMA